MRIVLHLIWSAASLRFIFSYYVIYPSDPWRAISDDTSSRACVIVPACRSDASALSHCVLNPETAVGSSANRMREMPRSNREWQARVMRSGLTIWRHVPTWRIVLSARRLTSIGLVRPGCLFFRVIQHEKSDFAPRLDRSSNWQGDPSFLRLTPLSSLSSPSFDSATCCNCKGTRPSHYCASRSSSESRRRTLRVRATSTI